MAPTVDAALLTAAEAVADVAGTVIRPFFRAAGLAADQKKDDSPVTIADRSAEQAMRGVLRERFPSHGILGEEFGLERPEAALRWVLDPIDGTRAFITGRPAFGTLIALLDGDTPILGVIDQPITGERWVGAAGRPTTFRGPLGGMAGTRPCPELGHVELSSTNPEMFTDAERQRWSRLRAQVRRASFGGDCYAYGLLTLGQIDIVLDADMKVWDWAALVPIIEGAGGRVTDWDGQKLRAPTAGAGPLLGAPVPVLAIGDPALHAAAVEALSV